MGRFLRTGYRSLSEKTDKRFLPCSCRIDCDIDTYRKADATFWVGSVKKGTTVKVEQISSEFVFGASAFNWNQLGTPEANARYRELFGTLFNRATVPFYWKDFERKSGSPRYEESVIDTEKWWNDPSDPMQQPHWRRPATDSIVDWCVDIAAGKHLDASQKLVEPSTIRPFFEKLGAFGIPTCLSEITITSAASREPTALPGPTAVGRSE